MSWSDVIGQDRVKRILRSSLERNRLAHAYLFAGETGFGTDAMAIELAKVVNCERSSVDACDRCPSCTKFNTLQHPNLSLVFALPVGKNETSGDLPLAKLTDDEVALIHEQLQQKASNRYVSLAVPKANTIKINSIREIRRESALTAFGSGMKVFIIIDADAMNDESANALLKTLEEPHKDTLLILTTSRPESLLPTIVSRCQHIRFDPIVEDALQRALVEQAGVDDSRARVIARLADGSYTRALQFVDTTLLDRRSEAVQLLRTMLHKSREELLHELDRITASYDKPEIAELYAMMQDWLRETMLHREGIVSSDGQDETVVKFVSYYPALDYAAIFHAIDRAISLLDKNVYIPLIQLNLALQLKKLIHPSSRKNVEKRPGMEPTGEPKGM